MRELKALVGNAADPEQVKRAGQKEREARAWELTDLRQVLSTPQGRRFVWKYLCLCGVFRSSVDHDPNMVYFHEGRREIGLALMADVVEADPAAYQLMADEARLEEQKREPTPPRKESDQ